MLQRMQNSRYLSQVRESVLCEHGELMDIVLSENFGYVCRIEEVSCKFAGEDLISGKCSLWFIREKKMPEKFPFVERP